MKRIRVIQFYSDSFEEVSRSIREGKHLYKNAIQKTDEFVRDFASPEDIIKIEISSKRDSVVVVYLEEVEG